MQFFESELISNLLQFVVWYFVDIEFVHDRMEVTMHYILVSLHIGLILPATVPGFLLGSHQQYLIPLFFLLSQSPLSFKDGRRQIMELKIVHVHEVVVPGLDGFQVYELASFHSNIVLIVQIQYYFSIHETQVFVLSILLEHQSIIALFFANAAQ